MGQILSVRTAAIGFAAVVMGFISFPTLPSASLFSLVSPVSVDRTFKGDRLPLTARLDKPQVPTQQLPTQQLPTQTAPTQSMVPTQAVQARVPIPVGCDRAFSPISAPRLSNIFGRCSV